MFGDRLTEIGFLMVAAPDDQLASFDGMIKHVQLALTDRSELSTDREVGVMSSSSWRLAELFAKHASLALNGLGKRPAKVQQRRYWGHWSAGNRHRAGN